MLKALYEKVNGKEEVVGSLERGHGTPLVENSLPEAAKGMAKGMVEEGGEPGALGESSIPEAAGSMARQVDNMAKGMRD